MAMTIQEILDEVDKWNKIGAEGGRRRSAARARPAEQRQPPGGWRGWFSRPRLFGSGLRESRRPHSLICVYTIICSYVFVVTVKEPTRP